MFNHDFLAVRDRSYEELRIVGAVPDR